MFRISISVAVAALLSGCAILDTGEIDYRRAETVVPSDVSKRVATYLTDCHEVNLQQGVTPKQCVPLLSERLFRQNVGLQSPIVKTDVYSIRLEHGLLANLVEPPISMRRAAALRNPFKSIGEIVILANTFEFPTASETPAEGSTPATTVTRFRDFTELTQTKVVYYHPDVQARQDLNFSNIPLQAPLVYNGNPVGIQIIVVELDRTSPAMKSLLGKLADLGKASNVVPGGQISSMLLELGTTLVSQNHDDIIFEYRFVLDPSTGSAVENSSPFEAGRYVLMRTQHRQQQTNWRNLKLDHNTGTLWETQDKDGTLVRPFNRESYLTLNIIKHPDKSVASNYDFKTLEQLGAELLSVADTRTASLDLVEEALAGKAAAIRSRRWSSDLSSAWHMTEMKARDFARVSKLSAVPAGCTLKPDADEISDIAEAETRGAAVRFHQLFLDGVGATSDGTPAGKPLFPVESQRELLNSLVPFFAPFATSPIAAGVLTDPAKFIAAYPSSNAAEFADAIVAEAVREGQAKTCDDLRMVRIAI